MPGAWIWWESWLGHLEAGRPWVGYILPCISLASVQCVEYRQLCDNLKCLELTILPKHIHKAYQIAEGPPALAKGQRAKADRLSPHQG
jgi:hypothetical protein